MLQYSLTAKNPKQPKKSVYIYFRLCYHQCMNEADAYEKMERDIFALANKYSATRIQISTLNFDRDFKRGQDNQFHLVSTKAVIRALGKTTKVPIGEGCEFSTFEEAEAYVKKHWSEYYKQVRAKRSDAERIAEAKRQKRYRERRKKTEAQLKRQQ